MSNQDVAVKYLELGAYVIPTNDKKPMLSGEKIRHLYDGGIYDQDFFYGVAWALEHSNGLALVDGSGENSRWRSIDFDGVERMEVVEKVADALPGAWFVRSGGTSGWHLHLRCEDQLPGSASVGMLYGPGVDHVELKWSRTQMTLPPSVHPETGKRYRFVRPELSDHDVPVIPPGQFTWAEIKSALEGAGLFKKLVRKVRRLNTMKISIPPSRE